VQVEPEDTAIPGGTQPERRLIAATSAAGGPLDCVRHGSPCPLQLVHDLPADVGDVVHLVAARCVAMVRARTDGARWLDARLGVG
jgi:hypothetical protein